MKEACGIVGVYARDEDVARSIFFGLYALQHRGQESAGISASDGRRIRLHTEMGLVSQAFEENDRIHKRFIGALEEWTESLTKGNERMAKELQEMK